MNTDPNNVSRFYLYLTIFVLLIGMASVIHYYRTKELKDRIEARDKENKTLKDDIIRLDAAVDSLGQEKKKLIKQADSLEAKETYYKNKYYIVNEKLRKVLSDYSSASPDDKWKLFTDSVNEDW